MIAILIKNKKEWRKALDYLFDHDYTWRCKLYGSYNDFLFDDKSDNYLKLENKIIRYNNFIDPSKDIVFESLDKFQESEYNIIS